MKNTNSKKLIGFCSKCDKIFDPPPDKGFECCKGYFVLLIEKDEYNSICLEILEEKEGN